MPALIPSELQIRGNPTRAVADAARIRGSWQSVADHTARDSIDPDVRKSGMIVYTQNDGFTWTLAGDLSTWNAFSLDPLRPVAYGTISTSDTSTHVFDALTLPLSDNATTEVSVVVSADSASDGKVFYRHAVFRRAGGAPVSLGFTSSPNNEAFSAGASGWIVTITPSGNNVTVVVQEPSGTSVKWTGSIRLTIGSST
jgi:hypothetical protein